MPGRPRTPRLSAKGPSQSPRSVSPPVRPKSVPDTPSRLSFATGRSSTCSGQPPGAPTTSSGSAGGIADPNTSVVSPSLRHHEIPNLFVVDGSVFPTSLGVNPSLTIYGLAHWATDGIAAAI